MAVSVEIRHVIVGECDCGVPKHAWQHTNHDHYWECDYGVIPTYDIENPAPLIIVARDWAIRRIGRPTSVWRNGKERTDVVTIADDDRLRLRLRTDYDGHSWIWLLEPAHWADPPNRYNNAHVPIYLGRWPD